MSDTWPAPEDDVPLIGEVPALPWAAPSTPQLSNTWVSRFKPPNMPTHAMTRGKDSDAPQNE